ncbi:hypothetical protein WMY93_012491 [Mugilogobius chulae]|uniref:Interferon-induced GTP-binding protein Mx n=1 Tax=Mugilogobius chulae TaxID=88201 RepID=A0AAW0P5K2_9GOBI
MNNTLNEHYEEKVRPCIDLIDSLRSLGVEQDLTLPAIAVIGDQSSGKSSVLEALSGAALPRGRKYPLVVKMRRTKEESWCGKVTYHKKGEIIQQKMTNNPVDVEKIIKEVKPWNYSVTSEGFLCLDIASPKVPDLTLVDLPSIPIEPSADQITSFLKSWIKKKCILILVVAPCDVDITRMQSMKIAKEADPNGLRTLGILTKADLVDKQGENVIVDIVQNKVVPLKKGYMIVRCLDTSLPPMPVKSEKAFFRDHALFKTLYDDGNAAIAKLADRLTVELPRHIEKCLPTLKEEIQKGLLEDSIELKRYGNSPPSEAAGRLTFLTDVSAL